MRQTPRATDPAAVRALIDATGYFYGNEADIAVELVEEALTKGLASGYHFYFIDGPEGLLGYVCYGPTPCTQSTWDAYWLAVDPKTQGTGLGRKLMQAIEADVAARGGTGLYLDTAGRELYASTRAFYAKVGYAELAVLPDFYAPGDAKVIFGKRL